MSPCRQEERPFRRLIRRGDDDYVSEERFTMVVPPPPAEPRGANREFGPTVSPTWRPPDPGAAVGVPVHPAMPRRPPEPRRTRWLLIVAVAALVTLTITVAAAMLGGNNEDDQVVERGKPEEVDDDSTFSLGSAVDSATSARSVRYTISSTVAGLPDPGGDLAFDVDVAVDEDAGIMAVAMDVSEFVPDAEEAPDRMEYILDLKNGMWYLGADAFDFPTDAAWVSIDIAAMSEPLGVSLEDLQSGSTDPLFDVASLFAGADEMADFGTEMIDDLEVRHFQVILDTREVLAANPEALETIEAEGLEDELQDEIPYDVWVTEDNQLRRMAFGFDLAGLSWFSETDIMEIGVPLNIELPAREDVVDVADLDLG